MKLFYAPEFSSLADHIAMLEAGLRFDIVRSILLPSRSQAAAAIPKSIRRVMCRACCSTMGSC
jgi:hypothetical protein